MQTIGTDFDQNSDQFTLDAIADMQMYNFAEEIADVSNAATMELAIETVKDYNKTTPKKNDFFITSKSSNLLLNVFYYFSLAGFKKYFRDMESNAINHGSL